MKSSATTRSGTTGSSTQPRSGNGRDFRSVSTRTRTRPRGGGSRDAEAAQTYRLWAMYSPVLVCAVAIVATAAAVCCGVGGSTSHSAQTPPGQLATGEFMQQQKDPPPMGDQGADPRGNANAHRA